MTKFDHSISIFRQITCNTVEKVFSIVRQTYGRKFDGKMKDIHVNTAIWRGRYHFWPTPGLTTFGPDRFLAVSGLCKSGAPKGVGQGGGPEGWEAQNFALFFPLPASIFALFVSLLGVFSWNFGSVFETPEPLNVRVCSSRLVV